MERIGYAVYWSSRESGPWRRFVALNPTLESARRTVAHAKAQPWNVEHGTLYRIAQIYREWVTDGETTHA